MTVIRFGPIDVSSLEDELIDCRSAYNGLDCGLKPEENTDPGGLVLTQVPYEQEWNLVH